MSPSIHTLKMLLLAMGEQLELSNGDLPREYDLAHRRATAERTLAERLALGISWNRMAGRLAEAGRAARDETEGPFEAERILHALAAHGVDYILIGGLAVQTHGHVRTTNDANLIPAPDPDNLKRLARALRSLDGEGDIDVMHEVPGGRSYEELREEALQVRLGDIDVPVVGLDDLIQMKLSRGRPVDLDDVASLTDPRADTQGGDIGAP